MSERSLIGVNWERVMAVPKMPLAGGVQVFAGFPQAGHTPLLGQPCSNPAGWLPPTPAALRHAVFTALSFSSFYYIFFSKANEPDWFRSGKPYTGST